MHIAVATEPVRTSGKTGIMFALGLTGAAGAAMILIASGRPDIGWDGDRSCRQRGRVADPSSIARASMMGRHSARPHQSTGIDWRPAASHSWPVRTGA